MMETSIMSVESTVAPTKPILRLVVRFCDKKFMVVVPSNATFMDVKNEVLRVYKGISPSFAGSNDLSISELRDYSGCILFDEYQVGLLIQDLTKIIALRPGEEASYSTISSTPIPSRSCTPLPQLQTNYIHEQPLATPTHGLLHGSSSLRLAGSQSSHLANSLDSLSHSSITSQLSTIDDTQVRKSTSNAKVPAEPTSQSVTDEGDLQQMDKQATKTLVNSMVYEDDHSVEGGQKQSYNTSGFNEYMSDDSKIHKGSRSSRSSSQSSELKSRRKKNVYSYSSSEEDGSTTLHAHPKSKGVALPPKKKTKERRISKRHNNQRRVDDKTTIPHQRSKLKTGRTTSCREKAKNKQQSTSVVRSKVPLHYPGYSSGWSSSGSDTNKDNIVSTQATNGREKDKSGDQFSAPSSINSTISTSSWTSSERDNKNGEVEKDVPDVPNRPLESGHSSDSQVHKGESIANNDHSDYGGAEDTDVITNLDGQESLPLGNEGSNSAILSNSGVEDIPDTHESTPFAPDSVDLVMEPQVQRNTSEPQQLEDSELEVTIIPETQETLADDTSLQGVIECPRSPVIPLQNKNSDQFSPLQKEESQQYNTPADIIISDNKKTKTTAVFHMRLSLSDMDSHVVPSVASITSDGQVRKQIQTKLTKKRHSRRAYLHSDVGESSSTTESGGIDSCLRKRKAKLLSKILGTCRMKKHPYRRDLSRSKFDSHIGIPRSDSEFIHPSPRQLTSLSCRKRKGLKLTKVSNSVTSKTECGGEKSKQEEIPVNVQQSRLSEDEPLVHKKKSKEGDSGVSSTNLSEVAPSPGTSDAQLNLERHTMMKKSKSKKRVSREVIKISSDSDSVEFEPPPFKKRRPRPNFSQQKKQKPTPVDEAYKIINSSKVDVDDLAAAVEKQASIVTDKVKHQGLSHTTAAEVKMADQPAAHTLQHEDVEIDEAKMHLTVSTSPDEPQSRIDKVINEKARCHSDDESDSSNSSNGDRDEGMKSTIGVELSAKREIDDDMSRESKDDKTEENLSVDKLTKANDSPSTSNLSSSDESVAKPTFQGTVGIATSPFSHTDKEDRPSTFHSEQEKKIKSAASSEQQSRHRVVPLPCIDSTPNKSEPDSSDSDDNASMQGTAVLSQQPVGGGVGQLRKIAIRPTQSSPKKSSLQKNLQSYTSSVHRPPRFLFCKSNIKKNYSQQLSKLKNPVPKAQGSYESENSTASDNSDSWSSSEEEDDLPKKKTGSLQMLIPKGQQRTMTVDKSNTKASTTPIQRRFSSDKSVRMFSLTPSVVDKKRNSPNKKTVTQVTSVSRNSPNKNLIIAQSTLVSMQKANGRKGGKKPGYRESSLSQQEVLLAEGGSQKLSELLADDKLWEDFKS